MKPWVDPTDPEIIRVVSNCVGTPEEVAAAVAMASEILGALTGYRIHPEGKAEQDYILNGIPAIRLAPAYRPMTKILSVWSVGPDCTESVDLTDRYCLFAGDARLVTAGGYPTGMNPVLCNFCCGTHDRIRMLYEFGSTVGAAGVRAVLLYAHQLWLLDNPGAGECMLPERVTSVTREGVSYTFVDPMDFLDKGRTGIPSVDMFLATANRSKALAMSGVFTPEAPPGAMRR